MKASGGKFVGDLNIFNSLDEGEWELEYDKTMDNKYKKNTKNFSKIIHGKVTENAKIFIIPRIRGESYKDGCKSRRFAILSDK